MTNARCSNTVESAPSRASASSVPQKVVMPGEHFVSWDPVEIFTLLGSCVSVCIWDSKRQIGGMNHIMLPDLPPSGGQASDHTKPLRYGLYAMERLLNDLFAIGAKREHLVAKVFGGANMTGALQSQHVGKRNGQFVTDFLARDRIHIAGQDLGGVHSRKIRFNTHSGSVRLERVPNADDMARQQEKRYQEKLRQDPVIGGVVFF